LAALVLPLLIAGCGQANVDTEVRGTTLTIYYGVPLHGPDALGGRAAVDGAKRALADAGGEAAGFKVEPVFLDDTGGQDEPFDSRVTADGARRAAQDVTALAYVGDLTAGALRFSAPIANEASMPQLAPAAVVRSLRGRRGIPSDLLQPTDRRTLIGVAGSPRRFGRAATMLLLKAIDRAGKKARERAVVLRQLRELVSSRGQAAR
jgi:hypothetical protein